MKVNEVPIHVLQMFALCYSVRPTAAAHANLECYLTLMCNVWRGEWLLFGLLVVVILGRGEGALILGQHERGLSMASRQLSGAHYPWTRRHWGFTFKNVMGRSESVSSQVSRMDQWKFHEEPLQNGGSLQIKPSSSSFLQNTATPDKPSRPTTFGPKKQTILVCLPLAPLDSWCPLWHIWVSWQSKQSWRIPKGWVRIILFLW